MSAARRRYRNLEILRETTLPLSIPLSIPLVDPKPINSISRESGAGLKAPQSTDKSNSKVLENLNKELNKIKIKPKYIKINIK